MNFIKSLFISLAPVLLSLIVIYGLVILTTADKLMGISMIFSALPLVLFLSYILLFQRLARTGKHLWPVTSVSLLGLVLGLFAMAENNIINMVMVISGSLLTSIYIYWYSKNDRKLNHQLNIGEKLPIFSTKDHNGNTINSSELINNPVIMMFTRGNWCPLCMAQINEVVKHYKQLDELGVKILIVASQSEKKTQNLAKRFAVPFIFIVDKGQALGRQLGIIHHFGLPFGFQIFGYQNDQYYPTIIATDKDGTIIYSDQTSNYRLRPEPEEFIKLYSNV